MNENTREAVAAVQNADEMNAPDNVRVVEIGDRFGLERWEVDPRTGDESSRETSTTTWATAAEATTAAEPTALPVTETHRLVGWGDFDDLHDQIKARLFGHLARLAAPVVVEYHSDLYRDAQWIEKNVTGPCQMDFVVRYHGTHLGMVGADFNMARTHIKMTSSHGEVDRFYSLVLTEVYREWYLTITRTR